MKFIYLMVLPKIEPGIPFKGEFISDDGFEIVKIGISYDVEKRRRAIFRDHASITVGSTVSLPFTDKDALDIEGVLHNSFAQYRTTIDAKKGDNLIEYFKVNKVIFEEMRNKLTDFCLAHLINLQIEVEEKQNEMAEMNRRINSVLSDNDRLEDERRRYMVELIDERQKMIGEISYKKMISQLLRSLLGDKSIERNELIFSALKMIEGVRDNVHQ